MTIYTPENRSLRGVVAHEAGHYVVAKSVGFQVLNLTIKRECDRRQEQFHGWANTAIVRPIENDDQLDEYLMHRLMVLHAGALAQGFDGTNFIARRIEEIREDNASDDWGKAMDIFAIYLNRRHAQDFGEYTSTHTWPEHPFWKRCEEGAMSELRKHWGAIERIIADAELGFKRPTSFIYFRSAGQLEEIGY